MQGKVKSGQILILVLLVVVVALAIGLSVASRNLTNLKTSTQAEQSQRAFSAAEGGVEDTLSRLNTVANVINTNSVAGGCSRDTIDTTNSTANCPITNSSSGVSGTVQVKAARTLQKTVETGDVAQINLATTGNGTPFSVNWGQDQDSSSNCPGTNCETASVEFLFVCQGSCSLTVNNGTPIASVGSGTYSQIRLAFGNNTHPGNETSISNCSSGATPYHCTVSFTLGAGAFQLLRMKPFWNKASMQVTGTGGPFSPLPVQTYQITSTATTDTGVSRKVQVSRDALPQLPAVFDYVLYSGQDIVK